VLGRLQCQGVEEKGASVARPCLGEKGRRGSGRGTRRCGVRGGDRAVRQGTNDACARGCLPYGEEGGMWAGLVADAGPAWAG
jgi:hypothetical protein